MRAAACWTLRIDLPPPQGVTPL